MKITIAPRCPFSPSSWIKKKESELISTLYCLSSSNLKVTVNLRQDRYFPVQAPGTLQVLIMGLPLIKFWSIHLQLYLLKDIGAPKWLHYFIIFSPIKKRNTLSNNYLLHNHTGWFFFNWSALKMTKYEEKLKYLNLSAYCAFPKVLSVNPQ